MKQTEELLSNGKVTSGGGRGRAFAGGTAYAMHYKSDSGSTGYGGIGKVIENIAKKVKDTVENAVKKSGSTGSGGGTGKSGGSSKKSSSSGGGSSKEEKEFEETIDWIETAIERMERALDKLDKKANNVYTSWSKRNKALTNQIGKVEEEIELQKQAYDKYMKKADSVGLPEKYAKKVRDGTIDIETITDEDLKKKIEEYQKWYNKALDCKDAIDNLKKKEAELYKQRFDNVSAKYEGILGVIEFEKDMTDEKIAQSEAKGWAVSGEYYNALASNEKDNIANLEQKKAEMDKNLQAAVESGKIEVGSEAWYEMVGDIDGVTLAIEQGKTKLLEYEKAARELSWDAFDTLQEKISSVAEEADFLIELLSNEKLYDDNGNLTNEGMAVMGLHGQNYNTYMAQADKYAEEIANIDKEIAKDPYNQDLIKRRQELVNAQQDSILAAEGEKEAIRDMVEEGINLELDALQERIDKYNESIEAQKDLYDYQKKVKKQTEEIAALEKQMAAYSGDTSEEAKAKVQELKVSLEEAKENLQEMEYDRYISDQQKLLDELYLEYEEILNTRLDNIDELLSDVISDINSNAAVIGDTIREATDSVGYTLSESMKTIWADNADGTTNVITTYGEKFSSAQTTTNQALGTINTNLQNMITQLNIIAKIDVASVSTSSASKSSTSTKNNTSTKKTTNTKSKSSSGGDGTPKIGEKVKFVSGQYYYDSYGAKPLGSKKQGKYVYITNINNKKGATHPYHISTGSKLGKGDLGWLKLNQISGYASGKKSFLSNEVAWTQENGTEFIVRPSDGAILTPIAKRDSVLNHAASKNIWDMANSPAEFIKNNLGIGAAGEPNNSIIQSNYTQHIDNVVFRMDNVKNYDEFLAALKKDRNFEHLIQSMTIDQIAGKSSLGKGKSIR